MTEIKSDPLVWVKDKSKGKIGTYMYQMHCFTFSHDVYLYIGSNLLWFKSFASKKEALDAAEKHNRQQ